MDEKKSSNKITEIVRLQQMLKKWKKLAVTPKNTTTNPTPPPPTTTTTTAKKSTVGFLKRTLSFTDTSSVSSSSSSSSSPATGVPRGFLAVCVGEELRRFVIPTEYLSQRAFVALLRDAEEEFGFQQEGVLRIPCEVSVFESTLKLVEEKNKKKKKKGNHSYCSSEVGWISPNTLTSQFADE